MAVLDWNSESRIDTAVMDAMSHRLETKISRQIDPLWENLRGISTLSNPRTGIKYIVSYHSALGRSSLLSEKHLFPYPYLLKLLPVHRKTYIEHLGRLNGIQSMSMESY
jgi:hypothetical protein